MIRPAQAQATARRFASVEDEVVVEEGREDLTDLFVFTIDPPDAKDFDDAISIEHDPTDDTIELDDATLRFVPATDGRGDGLAAIDVEAIDRARAGDTLELGGIRFNLV